MTFEILRPNWPNFTNYVSTNWLLRQPQIDASTGHATSLTPEFTYSDLRAISNGIGVVNHWTVSNQDGNQTTAETVRLEGPFILRNTNARLVLDFTSFTPMVGADKFAPGESCGIVQFMFIGALLANR